MKRSYFDLEQKKGVEEYLENYSNENFNSVNKTFTPIEKNTLEMTKMMYMSNVFDPNSLENSSCYSYSRAPHDFDDFSAFNTDKFSIFNKKKYTYSTLTKS